MMELDDQLRDKIEMLLAQLEDLDPSELPEPAAELAGLLGEILEGTDESE